MCAHHVMQHALLGMVWEQQLQDKTCARHAISLIEPSSSKDWLKGVCSSSRWLLRGAAQQPTWNPTWMLVLVLCCAVAAVGCWAHL